MNQLFYVIAGIAISAYSKFISSKNPGIFLDIFFWIGIIFVIIGIGKIGYKKLMNEQKKPVPKIEEEKNFGEEMKTCKYCGQVQYAAFNTCVKCNSPFRNTY